MKLQSETNKSLSEGCKSLIDGECNYVIAGGVELLLNEEPFIGFSKSKVLSKIGKCSTFDESADVIVLGEGIGLVMLKRYEDAICYDTRFLYLPLTRLSQTNNKRYLDNA